MASDLPEEICVILGRLDKKRLQPAARLDYSIFRGKSSLRELPSQSQGWIQHYGKSASALLLVSNDFLDAAHEVVLGVTLTNLADAEYAATHPGSGWTDRHPLSTTDDWIHAIVHRDGEGEIRGEGNHAGWENAMYWAAGGPKTLPKDGVPRICTHPVALALAAQAPVRAPRCCSPDVGLLSAKETVYSVLADGGGRRQVRVPSRQWDPFRFIQLLQDSPANVLEELERVRRLEFRLLLEHSLREKDSSQ
jgi:hypothetical protein